MTYRALPLRALKPSEQREPLLVRIAWPPIRSQYVCGRTETCSNVTSAPRPFAQVGPAAALPYPDTTTALVAASTRQPVTDFGALFCDCVSFDTVAFSAASL